MSTLNEIERAMERLFMSETRFEKTFNCNWLEVTDDNAEHYFKLISDFETQVSMTVVDEMKFAILAQKHVSPENFREMIRAKIIGGF